VRKWSNKGNLKEKWGEMGAGCFGKKKHMEDIASKFEHYPSAQAPT
jgi:hypothetical protein